MKSVAEYWHCLFLLSWWKRGRCYCLYAQLQWDEVKWEYKFHVVNFNLTPTNLIQNLQHDTRIGRVISLATVFDKWNLQFTYSQTLLDVVNSQQFSDNISCVKWHTTHARFQTIFLGIFKFANGVRDRFSVILLWPLGHMFDC